MKKLVIAFALLVLSTVNSYAISCLENVKNVIVHSNGQVYFRSDTCSDNWCTFNWTDTHKIDRAYALLLLAKAAQIGIMFEWPALSSCASQNQVYASPDFIQTAY